jgi:hypothetical protein
MPQWEREGLVMVKFDDNELLGMGGGARKTKEEEVDISNWARSS